MTDPLPDWTVSPLGGGVCRLWQPTTRSPHGYWLVYLHDQAGSGAGLALDSQLAALQPYAEELGWGVVAPLAPHTCWTDRLVPRFSTAVSAERFVAEQLYEAIGERWGVAAPQIALLGVGLGGQGALRLAYKYPNRFPIVAAIAPRIDFHRLHEAGDADLRAIYRDSEQARQDTATLHIHPLNWPRNQWFCCDPTEFDVFDGVDRLRMKLSSLGVPYECDTETSRAGETPYCVQMLGAAVNFLATRLDCERLRIV